MGQLTVEQALVALEAVGFPAEMAYPGRGNSGISQAVAAVQIEKVAGDKRILTLAVRILVPEKLGGGACEMAALTATQALQDIGAVCVQEGCSYDRVSRTYCVVIHADFRETGSGAFDVKINGVSQHFATAFQEEGVWDYGPEYVAGETAPVGFTLGSTLWKFQLEEQIPPGKAEEEEPEPAFTMTVTRGSRTVSYRGCCWTTRQRNITAEGLHRIRTGMALERKEEENG